MRVFSLGIAALLVACAPEFNWRELQAGIGDAPQELTLQLPCKPSRAERKLKLGDDSASFIEVNFVMIGCNVGDMSFTLGAADVGSKENALRQLDWLAAKLAQNIQSPRSPPKAFTIKGMLDTDIAARRYTLQGKLPDGGEVTEHALLFARGAHVYQATVIMPNQRSTAQMQNAANNFFDGLQFPRKAS